MADPLWIDFTNSDWHDWRGSGRAEDRLSDASWQRKFLNRWGWPDVPLLSDEQLQSARRLRNALRLTGVNLVAGQPVSESTIALVNDVLRGTPQFLRMESTVDGYKVRRAHVTQGWPRILGEIASSFATMLANDDIRRLRVCENPDCLWLFWDATKNASKRFCDDKTCANLMKVRRFRARQKHRTN